MIFLCFSVKDRIPLINDFYNFLSGFGLEIWYDRRNIFLGDNRRWENIENGANNPNVNYAIVFYSENLRKGNICIEEFEILLERYNKREITIFPVFISTVPEKLEDKFKICKELVYKQIEDQSYFPALSLHIIAKITYDEVAKMKYSSIKDIEILYDNQSDVFYQLIVEYQNIIKTNYNMRIAFLYATHLILSHDKQENCFHHRTMSYIYHQHCMNVLIDEKRELQIMENIISYEFSTL